MTAPSGETGPTSDSMAELHSRTIMPAPGPRSRPTVAEFLAAVSAVGVGLGFVFLVGVCSQLEWRLLQFAGPQDFLSVACTFVFAIFIFAIGYASYSEHGAQGSFFWIVLRYFEADYPPITPSEARTHRVVRNIAMATLALPLIMVLISFALVLTSGLAN